MFKIIWDKIDEWLMLTCLFALLGGVVLQVASRMTPGLSAPWTEEFVRFTFAALIFFGMSVAIKTDEHIGLSFLIDKLPPKYRRWFVLFGLLCFGIFLSYLGYLAWQMVEYYWARGMRTPSLRVQYAYVRSPIVFGSILSLVRIIERMVLVFRKEAT